jgi:HEAT repeat protein
MIKKFFVTMSVVVVLFLSFKGFEKSREDLETVYWYIYSMGASPQNSEIFYNKLCELKNDELIKKLKPGHKNNPYPYAAMNILAERQSKEAIPAIIELMKYPNYQKEVVRNLGRLNDDRSISALLSIVNDKSLERTYVWYLALESLAKLGYKDIYPIVLSLVNSNRSELANKVSLLGYFLEYPETIKELEIIANGKYPGYVRERAEELLEEGRVTSNVS